MRSRSLNKDLWPDGVIPYIVDKDLPDPTGVKAAMDTTCASVPGRPRTRAILTLACKAASRL